MKTKACTELKLNDVPIEESGYKYVFNPDTGSIEIFDLPAGTYYLSYTYIYEQSKINIIKRIISKLKSIFYK